MRCVGTDLKFHWVRHDEDSGAAEEAKAVDGSRHGGGGDGKGSEAADRGGQGSGRGGSKLVRRASASDRTMLKRKVRGPSIRVDVSDDGIIGGECMKNFGDAHYAVCSV